MTPDKIDTSEPLRFFAAASPIIVHCQHCVTVGTSPHFYKRITLQEALALRLSPCSCTLGAMLPEIYQLIKSYNEERGARD